MTTEEFKIIKKTELDSFFKNIIEQHIEEMGYDMNDPEDVEKLNKTLDEFSKAMFWGY